MGDWLTQVSAWESLQSICSPRTGGLKSVFKPRDLSSKVAISSTASARVGASITQGSGFVALDRRQRLISACPFPNRFDRTLTFLALQVWHPPLAPRFTMMMTPRLRYRSLSLAWTCEKKKMAKGATRNDSPSVFIAQISLARSQPAWACICT